MTKTELIAQVAEKVNLKKKDVEKVVNQTLASIQTSLSKGNKVQFIGFGTFEVKKRSARKGRNPQTGVEIKIPATKVPVFKAGKGLKQKVANKTAKK